MQHWYIIYPLNMALNAADVYHTERVYQISLCLLNLNERRVESFLRFLVSAGSGLFNHVESSVASIPDGELRFSQLAEPKALIHTWLAWQEEPGRAMGTAITARYLDPDVAQVDVLVSWLNRLYFP